VAFLPFGAARPNIGPCSIGDSVGRSVLSGRGHHEQAANFTPLLLIVEESINIAATLMKEK
jgi:hypothetical protein